MDTNVHSPTTTPDQPRHERPTSPAEDSNPEASVAGNESGTERIVRGGEEYSGAVLYDPTVIGACPLM